MNFFFLFLSAILVNNFVLVQFLESVHLLAFPNK